MDWPERGWIGEHPLVLSSFAHAQDDAGLSIRLSSLSELMTQYVGINSNLTRIWCIVVVRVVFNVPLLVNC
jgi:hypothetical protein